MALKPKRGLGCSAPLWLVHNNGGVVFASRGFTRRGPCPKVPKPAPQEMGAEELSQSFLIVSDSPGSREAPEPTGRHHREGVESQRTFGVCCVRAYRSAPCPEASLQGGGNER